MSRWREYHGVSMGRTEKTESAGSDFPPVRVTLHDERSVTIRAIRADDSGAMQAALDGLSAQARYNRFMGAINITPALVERAVRPAADRDRALVAVAGEGTEATIA